MTETTTELTAENVTRITGDCLFKSDEVPKDLDDTQRAVWAAQNAVIVEGVMKTFAFNPKQIEAHREEIASLIRQTPTEFHKSGGGGMSFLNLCVRADGVQWGEHHHIECLVCLAKACGLGSYLLSRDMWQAFPGGMPYVQFEV